MNGSATHNASDWKDRYFKVLNELDEQGRTCSRQLQRLRHDLVATLAYFRGRSAEFDRELARAQSELQHDDDGARTRALMVSFERLVAGTAAPADHHDDTEVLHRLFDAVPCSAANRAALDVLRDTLAAPHDHDNQAAVLGAVATTLGDLIAAHDEAALAEARDALQTLLDHLSLPASVQAALAELTARLQAAPDAATLRTVAKAFADCIAAHVGDLQAEVSNLGGFLCVVKGQLDTFADRVLEQHQEQRAAAAARDALDTSVQRSLDDLRGHVETAADIDQLKQDIQSQLGVLGGAVASYLQAESQRTAQAEAGLVELTNRIAAMREESEALRSELAAARARAHHDGLTGLPNRLAYEERLQIEWARLRRSATPLSLLVVDVDHFKRINDSWGHQAGDRVLRHLAREIGRQVRAGDFLARFGGEEFVVLLPDTPLAGAHALAESLRRHIAGCRFRYADAPVEVTVSCGVTEFAGSESPALAFERADRALYAAKRTGRNRCVSARADAAAEAAPTVRPVRR